VFERKLKKKKGEAYAQNGYVRIFELYNADRLRDQKNTGMNVTANIHGKRTCRLGVLAAKNKRAGPRMR